MYVLHEGKRCRVLELHEFDGEPGYYLSYPTKVGESTVIWARLSDCQPYEPKPPRKVVKHGQWKLEWNGDSGTIRLARTTRRYPVTLKDIFEWAEQRALVKGRVPSALRARKKRRS